MSLQGGERDALRASASGASTSAKATMNQTISCHFPLINTCIIFISTTSHASLARADLWNVVVLAEILEVPIKLADLFLV